MSEHELVDGFEGLPAPAGLPLEIDPELQAPVELVDRLRLWGSRARQVLVQRQQLLSVVEQEVHRLVAEREAVEEPAEHDLLEPLRDEMRGGFDGYLQALNGLYEALQAGDPALLDQALEQGEEAEERLRRLDPAYADVQEGMGEEARASG